MDIMCRIMSTRDIITVSETWTLCVGSCLHIASVWRFAQAAWAGMVTLMRNLEPYSFTRVLANRWTNVFLHWLYRSRGHKWLYWLRSQGSLGLLDSGSSWAQAHRNQQPHHGSCAVDHRRCWETRVSHLSHGCHAGSSAVRFRWPIPPGRSVVVGTARQYDQVPICGWPGGVFGRVRHVKVQIGLWHHERHAVLWQWPVAGRGECEFRISCQWHSVWR